MTDRLQVSWRMVRVWQRDRDVSVRLWRSELAVLIEPFIVLVPMGLGIGLFVTDVAGQSYLQFLGPGILAGYAMFAASYECSYGSFVRMEYQRTFDAIMVTPVTVEDIIAGEMLWGSTRALFTGCVFLVVLSMFGLVDSPWAVLLLPLMFLEGLLFTSLSMCYTAFAPSINSFNYFSSLFIYPMFFISGAFFPLDQLPGILQSLAWVFPLTPAVHVARGLVIGKFDWVMLWSLLGMLAGTMVLFYVALVLMRHRLVK